MMGEHLSRQQCISPPPDIHFLVSHCRDHPLEFAYGVNQRNEIITTTLPEASPLVLIEDTKDGIIPSSVVILVQLYAKAVQSQIRVFLLEYKKSLTPIFAGEACTVSIDMELHSLREVLAPFSTLIRQRRIGEKSPPTLLVLPLQVLEKATSNEDTRREIQSILEDGADHGLFVLIYAHCYSPVLQEYITTYTSVIASQLGESGTNSSVILRPKKDSVSLCYCFSQTIQLVEIPPLLNQFEKDHENGQGNCRKGNNLW